MAGTELATAWIRLVPTVEGIEGNITDIFAPAERAADDAGQRAGSRFSNSTKAAVGVGLGAAIAGTFVGLYKVGEIFDDVTDTIRVGTGAQGEALDGLVDVAKNVGTQVPAEFEAIGTTVADLNTRLGLSGDTLETVASQYLEAGRILGEEVDIGATSAAFSAFKIEGDAVSGAMDTLFQVSQATGVGMNELATGAQATAPALQALGFGFEDAISLVGSFDKAGLNSTAIMASMSKGLVTLAKDGEQPQEAYQRVISELQGFIDTGDQAAALDLASQVFGTRGASQFIGALESGVLNMDDLMAATGATGDTILGVGAETMDFAERWQMTMNSAMVAIEPLATAVFTAISDGLAGAMPFLQELGAWVGENTAVIGIIAGVIGVTLVGAFIAWTASIWAANIALLANPITWIILGIIALIAMVVFLVMNWETVWAVITSVTAAFIDWFIGVLDAFLGWWNGLWTAVWEWIVAVWNGIVSAVTGFFTGLWNTMIGIGVAIVGWWNGLWNGIVSFFTGIWQNIFSVIRTVQAVFGDVFNAVAGIVRGAFEGVVGIVRGVINGIIDAVNGVIGGINSVAGAIGGAIGLDISIGKLPRLAKGATVLPRDGGTAVILAEAGRPETVVDTGLMNRALEEGLDGGRGGLPSTLVLRVGDREFTAYVDERADGRVASYDSQRTREARRGERV